ncbi:MAG: CopD family protein [Planctomycetota bacterium]
MFVVKFLHVLGMVVYVGGFLALTRLVGKAVLFETEASRADSYRTFRRMHMFADWGGLAIMLVTGLILFISDPWDKDYLKQGYFHMKLTFVILLLVCDILFTRKLFFQMRPDGPQPKKAFFAALHGIAALLVVGAIFAIYVMGEGGASNV